jgi:hypothetical protein
MKKIFLLLLVFVFQSAIFNLQSVIHAQDSKPYFQQEVKYKINVKLDDKKHEFTADESMEYINNSPDELTFIWFHLWANGYKNNNTPLAKQLIADGNKKFYFANDSDRGYIDGLDFKVNGQSVKTEAGSSIDIIKLILNQPLKSGEKITISTPFHVKIPIGVFSRMGHIGQQYQITQWYPKPAVYDKYGWHPIPYLNQGEFYSEFGNFDVFITLPKNYVVGATGDLVDGEAETEWLNKKAEDSKGMMSFPVDAKFPPSSAETKMLHYHQEKVHDFAWFADKRYFVTKAEVILPYSKRKVTTWAMFTGLEGRVWKNAAQYVADAVYYYSKWNGDYAYNHATAVDGALSAGGGMEYPNITVIGKTSDTLTLDRVIAHEVGHNWFYGMLGSNERDHAWMDEGINSFNENRYMDTKYPPDKKGIVSNVMVYGINVGKLLGINNLSEKTLFDLGYRFNAVRKLDQPVDITSSEYTTINYGTIVYGKSAVILSYLHAYLGEEMYDKCAQAYFNQWEFKHPYPADIKKVYEEVSGKNLSWFFDDLIPTTKQIDYKICSVKKNDEKNLEIKIKNNGKINSPFSVALMYRPSSDNPKLATYITRWFDGFNGTKKVNVSMGNGDGDINFLNALKIDAQNVMPDINRQNNTLAMKGLCKKTEPFQLKMFGILHDPDKTQLFWSPVLGWNNYNKFMLGAAVYNNLLIERKLEWVVTPMYGFGNKDLTGGASVHYNIHPNSIFQTIRFGVSAEQYCYSNSPIADMNFDKITPEILFEIKKKHLRSTLKQTIQERIVSVSQALNTDYYIRRNINDLTYAINDSRKINPFDVSLNIQDADFVKTSLTANYKVTFKQKKKSLDIRFYAGKFFNRNDLYDPTYFFQTSGANGMHDYMYDNIFLGRTETNGFFSHQFTETEGAMKMYTLLGENTNWLSSLNLKCSLPKIPIRLFADFEIIPQANAIHSDVLFDAGIYLPLIPNIIDIYFPLVMSQDIMDSFTSNNQNVSGVNKYLRMVRFTFNINKLNPFEMVRNLSL